MLLYGFKGRLRRLVVRFATTHLATAPEVNFTLQHHGCRLRPITFAIFVRIIIPKSILRCSNVRFDLSHYFRSRRSSLTNISDIYRRSFRIVEMQNDIAVSTQQVEINVCTKAVSLTQVVCTRCFIQKVSFFRMGNHQVQLIDERIEFTKVTQHRIGSIQRIVNHTLYALRSLTSERSRIVNIGTRLT